MSEENNLEQIGHITHFFDNINVAAIKLTKPLEVGETILIKGETTNFEQKIDSMQVEKENIQKANAGDEIGIKVKEKVRDTDKVYRV